MPQPTQDDFQTVTDFTKSQQELVVELFNLRYGTPYTADQFTFSMPLVGTVESKNTDLVMYGIQSKGVIGSCLLHYNREPATVFLTGDDVDNYVYREDEELISDLLAQINEKFSIYLEPTDIEDAELPELDPEDPEDEKDFALTIKPSHLVYFGSIVLKLKAKPIDLGDAYGDTELDGFTFQN